MTARSPQQEDAEQMPIEETGRATFDAAKLVREHPPQFRLESKRRLYEGIPAPIGGALTVSRWRGALPATVGAPADTRLEAVDGYFSYPPDTAEMTGWHLNFADLHLFVAYGSALMAQDELQCMEHPVLGSLREALVARPGDYPGLSPFTRDDDGPTPVLVRGAQRSMAIDTSQGLYGNAFARAPFERVAAATTYFDPPTFSNIAAMQAPPGGYGPYDREEIEDILATAVIGFNACRQESGTTATEIHTGNWGTGAYGGNRVLMALLQLLAARLVGVERIVFHSGDGLAHVAEAERLVRELPMAPGTPISDLTDAIHARGFAWGVSDGN
jgi:hypothetical protein